MTSQELLYAVWPTAWGPMGAVASPAGLMRVILPHYSLQDLRALLAFEHPAASEKPEALAELAELTRQYFNGRNVDFSSTRCDLPAESTFSGKVLRACRTILYGQTRSYTWLARSAGNEDGARAAATVMGKNCLPLIVPCHRVIYAGGKLGGFSAPGGLELKKRMLQLEQPGSSR